jgi:hypothetical protein
MKLTKGTLKVIVTDGEAIVENAKRSRAGGKIFVPPYIIYEWTEELKSFTRLYAFGVKAKTLNTRYSLTTFPYAWAPRDLIDMRAWLETTDELTLVTQYTEANDNG